MKVILGLAAIGFFLYTVFSRYISAKKSLPPPAVARFKAWVVPAKDSLVPFTSGLSYKNRPCINELDKPTFERYASGIIRLSLSSFSDLNRKEPWSIEISAGSFNTKICAIACGDNFDFFIANLPFEKTILLTLGVENLVRGMRLSIEQTAGLYTIKDEVGIGLNCEPVFLGCSKVLTPHILQELFPLTQSFSFNVDTAVLEGAQSSKDGKKHLTLCSKNKRSVIYILLVSNNPAILVEERALALPLVIDDHKTTFSLLLLDNLWVTQYRYATGKNKPSGDLQLHLGGHQQIIYSETVDCYINCEK